MYQIKNIHLEGNEHGQLRKDTLYAELIDDNGETVISATLEHILASIRNNRLPTKGVTVTYTEKRGVMCSSVCLLCG